MPNVVGIRFKDSGKIYYFAPIGVGTLIAGDTVIVDTVRGPELAKVAYEPRNVADGEIIGELKPVLRRAEEADFARLQALNERHDEVLARCTEKIVEHNLPMRLIKAEYSFDGSRLTFYFTADKRVDFRLLVRDLARAFKTRIELRQIGPRDEAKLLGGIGPCGRVLCCATFLPDYARVSIKMAKDQDLPLNPSKISGVCGRLLCCLSYEHEQYIEIKNELPRKGAWLQTPDGPGEVVAVNVVRETVTVMLAETGVQEEYKPDVLHAAAEKVGALARSRNSEGITPATRQTYAEAHPPRPPREPKHHGERRLLRDEIENPDVLDALAMLEEGDWDEGRESRGAAPARASEQRSHPQQSPPVRPRIHDAPRPAEGQRPPPSTPADGQRRQRPPMRQTGPAPRPNEPTQPAPPAPKADQPRDDQANQLQRRRRRK